MWEPGRGLERLAEACMVRVHRNCHVYGAGGAMMQLLCGGAAIGAVVRPVPGRRIGARLLELRQLGRAR